MKFSPFGKASVYELSSEMTTKAKEEILGLDNEYVVKCSAAELEGYYASMVKIDPLVLHTDEAYIQDQKNTPIEVRDDPRRGAFRGKRAVIPGTTLNLAIPYSGNPRLWHCAPSSVYTLHPYPEIEVLDDMIVFRRTFPDDTASQEKLKSEIDAIIASLADTVNCIRKDVEKHNESAPREVITVLNRKRKMAESVLGAVSALGFPIRRREKPLTFTAPVHRKKSPVQRPTAQTENYQPEPLLDEAEYSHILEVMRSVSLVMERSPRTFATLDEEALRTHFLLQLNGHYEGGATGETFNACGKTDILIRVENKNIFIAECKFWTGGKGFGGAIDQLLGYLTWRDAKCALIVFNKRKDSVGVARKMHEEMEKRSEHRRTLAHVPNGDSKYIFVKESEPGREITITTQLYDIPLP